LQLLKETAASIHAGLSNREAVFSQATDSLLSRSESRAGPYGNAARSTQTHRPAMIALCKRYPCQTENPGCAGAIKAIHRGRRFEPANSGDETCGSRPSSVAALAFPTFLRLQ